ncbi:MAG: DNA-binding protein [Nitrospirae bacterium]|nr:MAG: DNA-binding protein [Nitrospirota bacterium]
MEYQIGKQGRIFLCKLSTGEDLIDSITKLAEKENIKAAFLHILGAIEKGKVVVGPRVDELPPIPIYKNIDRSHELIGIGTIFYKEGKPMLHIHAAFGRNDAVTVGCLRDIGKTFVLLEVIIIEIEGIFAERAFDPQSHMYLLKL